VAAVTHGGQPRNFGYVHSILQDLKHGSREILQCKNAVSDTVDCNDMSTSNSWAWLMRAEPCRTGIDVEGCAQKTAERFDESAAWTWIA